MRGWTMVVGLVGVLSARPASALYHFAVIDEIMSGTTGDPTVQYVEIRMLAGGQTVTGGSKLTAFNCDGSSSTVILTVGGNITVGGAGVRWIMASPSFEAAACIHPDFTFATASSFGTSCGMICWGKPASDTSNPNQYVDCVSYGPYTGPTKTGGGTSASPAGDGAQSLTRGAGTTFALATASPQNDKSEMGIVSGGPCPTTTTTTPTGSTTTTTIGGGGGGGGGPGAGIGPTLSGGGAKTDCFGEWRVAGAAGPKPLVKCKDGDASCDKGTAPGCLFQAQLCFGDAADPLYKGKCTSAPVTSFQVVSPAKDAADQANAAAIGAALVAMGASGGAFASPPAAGACTGAFQLSVPLKTAKSGKAKKGVRTLKTLTTAGKADRDKLKLICTP